MDFYHLRRMILRNHPEPDRILTSPYSATLLELLASKFGLEHGHFGAELGPGSGRLAQLFLSRGYTLLAQQNHVAPPSPGERADGIKTLWTPLQDAGGAMCTLDLPDQSVDFVISERALFAPNREALKSELRRILKPEGIVAIITDNRVYGGGEQTEEFENLLRKYCRNFQEKKKPRNIGKLVREFFGRPDAYHDAFMGVQALTLEQFLMQTSRLPIFPAADDPARNALRAALCSFFERWSVEGVLRVPVVCRVACIRLDALDEDAPEHRSETLPA
jgi:SAM-dependent methyltransferase